MLLQCVEAEIGEFGAEELDHMLLSVCCPPPPPHPARVARSLGDRTGQVHEVYCGQVGGKPLSAYQPRTWPMALLIKCRRFQAFDFLSPPNGAENKHHQGSHLCSEWQLVI